MSARFLTADRIDRDSSDVNSSAIWMSLSGSGSFELTIVTIVNSNEIASRAAPL
jgi:hypothetical protein